MEWKAESLENYAGGRKLNYLNLNERYLTHKERINFKFDERRAHPATNYEGRIKFLNQEKKTTLPPSDVVRIQKQLFQRISSVQYCHNLKNMTPLEIWTLII